MVENIKKEIDKENIMVEIKRADALSSWTKMSNEEKLDFFISRLNSEILDWHYRTFKYKRKASLNFEIWKTEVEQEYGNRTSLFDVLI